MVPQAGIQVTGNAETVNEDKLWLFLQVPSGKLYFTSGTFVTPGPDGSWSQATGSVGRVGPDDANKQFSLVAVAADWNATSNFERIYQTPRADGDGANIDTLPVGAHSIGQTCLTRLNG